MFPNNPNNPVLARTIVIMRLPCRHTYMKMLLDLDLGLPNSKGRFDLQMFLMSEENKDWAKTPNGAIVTFLASYIELM